MWGRRCWCLSWSKGWRKFLCIHHERTWLHNDYVIHIWLFGRAPWWSNTTNIYWQFRKASKKTFNHTVPFHNYFQYWHLVNTHNAKCHAPISVKESLQTKRWLVHQFCFLIAVLEVNVKLGLYGFKDNNEYQSMLKHWHKLACQLIYNDWLAEENPEILEFQEKSTSTGAWNQFKLIHVLKKWPVFTGKYDTKTHKFKQTRKKYSVLTAKTASAKHVPIVHVILPILYVNNALFSTHFRIKWVSCKWLIHHCRLCNFLAFLWWDKIHIHIYLFNTKLLYVVTTEVILTYLL